MAFRHLWRITLAVGWFVVPLASSRSVGRGDETRSAAPVVARRDEIVRTAGIVPVAAMRVARMAHTASRLRDGRILIAGGLTDADHANSGAEAYDPATARFRSLPPLGTLRHSHTATVLPDGKVLLVGGYAERGRTLAEAELFDPTTNTFMPTGSLGTPRAGHIAVALLDGTVLVAGGVGPNWQFLASAERYDPATGRFMPTGAMTVARESHTAVRLHDGQVLIVGGHQGRHAAIVLYASAERYDAFRGTFRRVGAMAIRRHKHDAVVVPDGRVLISGGTDERDNAGVYRSTEWFNPRTNSFAPGPALARPRYKHNGNSVVLPDGRVLLAGGASQAETFDPRSGVAAVVSGTDELTGQFSAVAPLATGGVLITGGYGHNRGPQAAAWLYRP